MLISFPKLKIKFMVYSLLQNIVANKVVQNKIQCSNMYNRNIIL